MRTKGLGGQDERRNVVWILRRNGLSGGAENAATIVPLPYWPNAMCGDLLDTVAVGKLVKKGVRAQINKGWTSIYWLATVQLCTTTICLLYLPQAGRRGCNGGSLGERRNGREKKSSIGEQSEGAHTA